MTLTPDIIDDETEAAEGILAAIADRIPGWEPAEGDVETSEAEAVGIAIATAATVLRAELLNAYLGIGQNILNVQLQAAEVASAIATFALDTVDGLVIDAGEEFVLTTPDGTEVVFVLPEDLTVPPATTTVTGVELVALDAGADANTATNPVLEDTFPVGLESVTITTAATGGADAEDIEEYVPRAIDRGKRLHSIPVTPTDFAASALDVPWVARCAALNRYDPSNPGDDSPGHLTLFPVDADGSPGTTEQKEELAEYLEAQERIAQVQLHIEDVESDDITLALTVIGADGYDDATVEAEVQAATTAGLDPAGFDADADQPGGWAKDRTTTVNIFDIAAMVDDLDSVLRITACTVNGGNSVTLTTPIALPNLTAPATVTVT